MTTFTKEELLGLQALIIENKNSSELQETSNLGNDNSINLEAKIDEALSDLEKKELLEKQLNNYEISFDYNTQEMVIIDNSNDITYRIKHDLLDEDIIAPYWIANRESERDALESYIIPEARSDNDKELMRIDLETLSNAKDEFVFGNYGTNGFITKDEIECFNNVCLELIESYQEYIKNKNK